MNIVSERALNRAYRERARITQNRAITVELGVEFIHPGHFHALPPSPDEIVYRMIAFGLAKTEDFIPRQWI